MPSSWLWHGQSRFDAVAMRRAVRHSVNMRHLLSLALPLVAGAGLVTAALAEEQPLDVCATRLEAQGFRITDRDREDGLYEFEAIKAGQEWEIKTDRNCKILLQRLD